MFVPHGDWDQGWDWTGHLTGLSSYLLGNQFCLALRSTVSLSTSVSCQSNSSCLADEEGTLISQFSHWLAGLCHHTISLTLQVQRPTAISCSTIKTKSYKMLILQTMLFCFCSNVFAVFMLCGLHLYHSTYYVWANLFLVHDYHCMWNSIYLWINYSRSTSVKCYYKWQLALRKK